MCIVLPFKALRPQKKFVKAVASYPYDVVSVEEAREIVKDNPLSFLRVEKSDVDAPFLSGDNNDRIYDIAKMNLERLVREGVLFQDEEPCFYIYRQISGSHKQYGIVARVSIDEYESGRIKKHELTRADKEVDRIKHVLTVNAHTGPVFLAYKAQDSIDRMIERMTGNDPEYDFTADDGVSHTVWVIRDRSDITTLTKSFEMVDTLYIADGHHRAAAAAAVGKVRRAQDPTAKGDEAYNFFMVVIFPHNQLQIMSYNRVVRDLFGMDDSEFLRKLRERFDVFGGYGEKFPRRRHDIGMYLRGGWYRLSVREGSYDREDPVKVLDVSILHDNLLRPLLGIENPRTDKRIEFVGGVKGVTELERLVDSGKFAVAFSLYPTSMGQLMAVSENGRVMPPKSTWFEPKLLSGIFVHLLK